MPLALILQVYRLKRVLIITAFESIIERKKKKNLINDQLMTFNIDRVRCL